MNDKFQNYNKEDLAERLSTLQRTAVELLQENDLQKLLELIVSNVQKIMICDGGSLYLKGDNNELVFEVAQNSSVDFEFKKYTLPITSNGIAVHTFKTGKSVLIDDVYQLPLEADYGLDKSFDKKAEYRTKSILARPLKNSSGEIIGVIQIINRKNKFGDRWPSKNEAEILKMPVFSIQDEEILASFASLASAAIENATLHNNIQHLLEGFVKASVNAIEVRDQATSGHSERVAILTCALAETISESSDRELKDIVFSKKEIKEIEYASLLHDFGKIGIKEEVLLKQEKLYPIDKLALEMRVSDFSHIGEIRLLRNFIEELYAGQKVPNEMDLKRVEKEIFSYRSDLKHVWQQILSLNKTAVLDQDNAALLKKLQAFQFYNLKGYSENLLNEKEVSYLSITRGSLNDDERSQINLHVNKTFEFLERIPWTNDFKNLTNIAYAHHEKLDGSGYPRKLQAQDIPVQSKIMTIIDIFDALVAQDRPYKRAVPLEKSLQILSSEVSAGKLDAKFLDVFIQGKLYQNQSFNDLIKGKRQSGHKLKKVG